MNRLYRFLVIFAAMWVKAVYAQNDKYSNEELAFMPVTLLLELYKQGEVSPVDVVKAQKLQWV